MKFNETHEWIELEGDVGVVGISSFAQKELGDIVFVELPKVGKKIAAQEVIAVLESTKAAADVYSPVSGTVVAVNEELKTAPELINNSSEKKGWIFKVALSDLKELDKLMDQEQYASKFN
jgi:glycine cleavage system H protein